MPGWYWTRWQSREGLEREAESGPRRVLAVFGRAVLLAVIGWGTFSGGKYAGWGLVAAVAGLVTAIALCALYLRVTREQRPVASYLLVAVLVGGGWLANQGQAYTLADFLWIGLAVTALIRLPPAPALLTAAAALGSYTAASPAVGSASPAPSAVASWSASCCGWTSRRAAPPVGCWSRSGPSGPPRRRARRSPNGPGSPGRSTTCSPTASPRSWSTWRRPG